MGTPVKTDRLFDARYFDGEVVALCFRWYWLYRLDLRNLVDAMLKMAMSWSGARRAIVTFSLSSALCAFGGVVNAQNVGTASPGDATSFQDMTPSATGSSSPQGRASIWGISPVARTAAKQIPVPTPPMGWSSWNSLAESVNYRAIKAEADGMAALNARMTSGARYQYVNIDEGWWTSGQRDEIGNFIVDTNQWPGGMQAIARYIHGKGLKAGIYIDAGPQGCGKRADGTHFVGSDGAHYDHDFLQFAQWGFDFVKVDFCGGRAGYDPQIVYSAISRAIQKAWSQTGQLLMLSICDWGTVPTDPSFPDYNEGPWAWGAGVGTMWRTTADIYWPGSGAPDFGNITRNLAGNYHPEGQHTGHYNDPDMMVAGMGMSAANDKAHVSLWAISGAPMILGNDLSKPLADATVSLLTNPEMIAIDQDALGVQGLLVAQSGALQVWSRLLAGTGRRAVVLFNHSAADTPMTVTWRQLGLVPSSPATVRDVWARKDLGSFATSYTVPHVPAGGVVMLTVSGSDMPATTWHQGAAADDAAWASCPACVNGKTMTGPGLAIFGNVASKASGGFIRIAYINDSDRTTWAQLKTNGGRPTTLAFPPTGSDGSIGTITAFALFQSGPNTLALSRVDSSTPAPAIGYMETVAGPVPLSLPMQRKRPKP